MEILNENKIDTTTAIDICRQENLIYTRWTIIKWCKKYEIGYQMGNGRWVIDKQKLMNVLNGEEIEEKNIATTNKRKSKKRD